MSGRPPYGMAYGKGSSAFGVGTAMIRPPDRPDGRAAFDEFRRLWNGRQPSGDRELLVRILRAAPELDRLLLQYVNPLLRAETERAAVRRERAERQRLEQERAARERQERCSAVAAERRARAERVAQARRSGMTWGQAARVGGYKTPGGGWQVVENELGDARGCRPE